MDLPRASNQREDIKPETIRLSITADGKYHWNESDISDDELEPRLKAEAAKDPQPTCTSAATRTCATNAWRRPCQPPSAQACARSAS